MKSVFSTLCLLAVLCSFSSCASIFSRSKYPVNISTLPQGAAISIKNAEGTEVYTGVTPATVTLKASAGFLKKASYICTLSLAGYETKVVPIDYKIDGWYFGNILIGGLIGLLIIDPATGAMWKLDTEFISETLTQQTAMLDKAGLQIYDINNVPASWQKNMVKIAE